MNQTDIEAHLQALDRILRDCEEQMVRPGQSVQDLELMSGLSERFKARRAAFEAALGAISRGATAARAA